MRTPSEIIKQIQEDKRSISFISTGFPKLDEILDGGFLRKEVIILGAFTGVGKSIVAGQLCYQIARQQVTSAYFSLEISKEMIISRLIGQLANIKPSRVMNSQITEPLEIDSRLKAQGKLVVLDEYLHIYDDLYLLSELEKTIRENKYEFVVIDFIQNILLEASSDEYSRLGHVSIRLQKLAKEVNCCILVLSQLSNKVGSTNSQVVEYKGSGAIAMVADLGFFLERDAPTIVQGQPIGNQMVRLGLRKNRRGISGSYLSLNFIHPGGMIVEHE